MLSLEKWEKTQAMIQWIKDEMGHPGGIPHKQLERYRGSLIYVSHMYPSFIPYLKGVHLTLDSWRKWQRKDGWKMSQKEIRAAMIEKGWEESEATCNTGVMKAPA
jgi:hypothetical protein